MAKTDFTYLKIVEILPLVPKQHRMVKALCTLCDTEVVVRKSRITGLEQASCGCLPHWKPENDKTGETINGLTFLGFIKRGIWKVQYACGHLGESTVYRAETSATGFCNKCSNALPTTESHGMSKTPTYSSWSSMRRRCYTETNNRFEFYGEKGIDVYAPWNESFEAFFADMGECPDGFSLERKDLTLGYYPYNCIWADDITQANNKTSNILIENEKGESWSLRRWCDILGKDYKAAWHKLRNKNMSIEDILGIGYTITQMR